MEANLAILSRPSLCQPFIDVIYGSKPNHSHQISFMLLIYLFIYSFIWSMEADLVILIDCLFVIYLFIYMIYRSRPGHSHRMPLCHLFIYMIYRSRPGHSHRLPLCHLFIYMIYRSRPRHSHRLPLCHLFIYCPACRTTFIATRFRVAVICPIIPVPHCIRVLFYFVWFVFINHIFQFYYELCTYCNILDIYLS